MFHIASVLCYQLHPAPPLKNVDNPTKRHHAQDLSSPWTLVGKYEKLLWKMENMLGCKYPASCISLCRGNVVILCVSAYSQPRCRNQGSRDKSANQASQIHHMMTLVSTLLNTTKYTWPVIFSRTLHIFLSFLIFHFRMSNSCRIPRGFRTQRLDLLVVFTIFKSIFSLTPIHKVWDRALLKLGYEEVGVSLAKMGGWATARPPR